MTQRRSPDKLMPQQPQPPLLSIYTGNIHPWRASKAATSLLHRTAYIIIARLVLTNYSLAMCDSLLADWARLRDKQRQNTEVTLRLVDRVSVAVEEVATATASTTSRGLPSPTSLDDVIPQLVQQHKTYHAALSKFIKAVDRIFLEAKPPVVMCRPSVTLDPRLIDEMVALHLYRQGRTCTAAKLVEEAGLSSAALRFEAHEALARVHKVITAAMERRELGPACRWAAEHHEGLQRLGSNLEFQLARLQFLVLLTRDNVCNARWKETEVVKMEDAKDEEEGGKSKHERGRKRIRDDVALTFARQHLAPFAVAGGGHMEQVRTLMGCLLYAGRLDRSPYQDLLSPELWEEAMEALHTEGCRLLGLPVESPLSVCYRASLRALGPLAKMRQVVQNSTGDWEGLEELPGEIDLGGKPCLRFHSVFSCPVTREQASWENPPMMLKCGHVICRSSLARLMKGGHGHNGGHPQQRFKCFVCPVEQYPQDAQQLYF